MRSRRQGIATCVASSGGFDKMDVSLGVTGLLALFEGRIFSASQVPRGKPFPDLFLHAAIAMNEQPFDCIVVEDSVPGVQAAQVGRHAGAGLCRRAARRSRRDGGGGRVPVRRHEASCPGWCCNDGDRLVVDGRGQARARDRARRRHGGARRGAAAARFGFQGHACSRRAIASAGVPGPTIASARRSISAARGCMASTAIRWRCGATSSASG